MINITSLRQYASSNPDKRIEVDYDKLSQANASIRTALKNNAKERREALVSASKVRLTK